MYRHFLKRFIDFFIALLAVICLSPLLLIIIVWLHFANKGAGVFFMQERPGLHGREVASIIQNSALVLPPLCGFHPLPFVHSLSSAPSRPLPLVPSLPCGFYPQSPFPVASIRNNALIPPLPCGFYPQSPVLSLRILSAESSLPSPLNQHPPNLVQGHKAVPQRFHRNTYITIVLRFSLPS